MNSLNYKCGLHDSRLGRFFAVDPLHVSYPHNSPYAFSENRLIDGDEVGLYLIGMGKSNGPAIHISAHSYYGGMYNNASRHKGEEIDNKKSFTSLLQTSDQLDENTKIDNLIIVLHSCRTGRDTDKYGDSFAKDMSKKTGATIISPTGRVSINGIRDVGTYEMANTDPDTGNTDGNWVEVKNKDDVTGWVYNKFIKEVETKASASK